MTARSRKRKDLTIPTIEDSRPSSSDAAARQAAWDTERSWIVEAPAGSGKTELLMQRFLRLLGRVEQPEQVLAITFTRKAAAEMRDRILESLREARSGGDSNNTTPAHRAQTLAFAREALEADAARGWNLAAQADRLNIRTIDSLCDKIAARLPVLSRMGGPLRPVEETADLYRQAARATFEEMGGADAHSSLAAQSLLRHLDNRMDRAIQLLAEMLGSRDHWGHKFLIDRDWSDEELDTLIRDQFEAPLRQLVTSTLLDIFALLPLETWKSIFELAHYAAGNLESRGQENVFHDLAIPMPPACDPECLSQWKAAARLLLTDGNLRKSKGVSKTSGFPAQQPETARMKVLLDALAGRDDLVCGLVEVLNLPSPEYTPEQRDILRASFRLLRRALGHLKLAFAASGETDFVEVSIAAGNALADDENSLALAFGTSIQHLLVDEMQDTSLPHFEMLAQLVRGWDGRSQTVFLVGDPKQSIYRFRHVDVRLFDRARQEGLGGVALEPISLCANFRSRQSLVVQTNEAFHQVFHAAPDRDAILFESAEAAHREPETRRVFWHPQVHPYRAKSQSVLEPEEDLDLAEAREICDVIERHHAQLSPGETPPGIAVLVRARSHTGVILRQMRERGISYRAVQIDRLSGRQPLLDLVTITRCLLHPADRIAWLAALRAPWCGLTLRDLLVLCGDDDPGCARQTVSELFRQHSSRMSADGQLRATRTMEILLAAVDKTALDPLSAVVERTWYTLGGPDCIPEAERSTIPDFFQLLDELEREGEWPTIRRLEERMQKLSASPRSDGNPPVEVLTLFKAKGLEWDIVLLPGLHRWPNRDKQKLVDWMEHVQRSKTAAGQDNALPALVVAPIQHAAEEKDAIRAWIQKDHEEHSYAELKRLLYVGWTRARQEIHLFGRCRELASGELAQPRRDSLLSAAWPCAELVFQQTLSHHGTEEAASSNLVEMPVPVPGAMESVAAGEDSGQLPVSTSSPSSQIPLANFHRLPADWVPPPTPPDVAIVSANSLAELDNEDQPIFGRPQGSWRARLFGTTMHTFLPLLAQVLERVEDAAGIRASIEHMAVPIRLQLIRGGSRSREAATEARRILDALQTVAHDPEGRWVLRQPSQSLGFESQAPFAGFEVSLSGRYQNAIRSIRVDRMFLADETPLTEGQDYLWIVDFKTAAHGLAGIENFLENERGQYEAQLNAYAAIVSAADPGHSEIRLGLYYPLLPRLIWWHYRP